MAIFGIIKWQDRKVINYRLLIFVSAIISIGKVLLEEGIAVQMSHALLQVFPSPESPLYLIALIMSVIAIHLMIGSSLATLSVIMVPLIALTEGVLDPVAVGMISYMIVNTHYILPIHNTVLLMGYGEKHFTTAIVAKYGGYMTAGIFVAIYGMFFPWWSLIGLM